MRWPCAAASAKLLLRWARYSLSPEQFVPTRHILARRIDENDDRRAAARSHRREDMTGQQDRTVDPKGRTADDADDRQVCLAIDLGGAVQRSRWSTLHLMTGREQRGQNVIELHDRLLSAAERQGTRRL